MRAREKVCARQGAWVSGVQVPSGIKDTISAAPTSVSTTLAIRCSGSASFQLLRSKVNRRANAYTGGGSNDQTNEIVTFQVSNCAQLSGLPMDAAEKCAPAARRKASTVRSKKPMAQTRPHCFSMVSYLLRMNPRQLVTSCTDGVIDEIQRQMFPRKIEK